MKLSALWATAALSIAACGDVNDLQPDVTRVDASRADRATSDGGAPHDAEAMDASLSRDADPEPNLPDVVAMDVAVTPDATALDARAPLPDVAAPRDVVADVPIGRPVTRTINYRMATYTQRNNWVHDCGRGYAYTAQGAEHIPEDCDGLYRPDGTLRGTATFTFDAVIAGTYDIVVSSRFSANRDANGALFVVNGERFTLDQRPGSTLTSSTLARRALGGRVTVVLDSSRGGGSDSVQSVTLRP